MSTRGVIARVQGDGWKGIYHHSDSYPTWLGRELWRALQNEYEGDVEALLKDAVDEHPGGWSSFSDRCYCHDPERKDEGDMIMTDRDCDPLFIEWVYAFDPGSRTMSVFSSAQAETLLPGQHGTYIEPSETHHLDGTVEHTDGHYYVHRLVGSFPTDGDEPNWEELEKE